MAQPGEPCYLIEWYRPPFTEQSLELTAAKLEDCAAAMCAEGAWVQLLTLLAVPSDEVVFAVFAASSSQIAAQTCVRAGLPAERLTAAAAIRAS